MSIQLMAYLSGSPLPFSVGGLIYSTTQNNTFSLKVVSTPNHPQPIGWHPAIQADGYCLPGETLPGISFYVNTKSGAAIEGFASRHSVTAFLVSYSFGGRISLPPITPIPLNVVSLGDNLYGVVGTLPTTATWLGLQVCIDGTEPIVMPLWPVGVPAFLISGPSLSIIGTSFLAEPFTSSVTIQPYLMATAQDTTALPGNFLDPTTLFAGLNPEDSFMPTGIRERYNSCAIGQGATPNCYVYPSISNGVLTFKPTGGVEVPMFYNYPTVLSTITTCPIFSLTSGAISLLSNSSASQWWGGGFILNMPPYGSAIYSQDTFTNYTLSTTSMPLNTKLCQLSIFSNDVYGNPVSSNTEIANLTSINKNSVGFVIFDPTNPIYADLLDPVKNYEFNYFLRPMTSFGNKPLYLVGGLTTTIELVIFPLAGQVNPLPSWTTQNLTLPIYLVQFNGSKWVPYTQIDRIPFTVTGGSLTLTNDPIQVTSRHQAQETFLTSPFFPLAITGSPIQASLPLLG